MFDEQWKSLNLQFYGGNKLSQVYAGYKLKGISERSHLQPQNYYSFGATVTKIQQAVILLCSSI